MFITTADLISLRDQLKNKLTESLNIAEEINIREKTVESLVREATLVAQTIIGRSEKNKPAAWKKK